MRMSITLIWLIASCLGAAAWAQETYDEDETTTPRATEIPAAGFWPTDRMIELVIDRITEEAAGHYGFDDDQLENMRLIIKDRFPDWLQENRAEVQTLVNTYVETLLQGHPPTSEEVAAMARRALPLFDEFDGLVQETAEDMRLFMTDEQQVLLDGEMAAFSVFLSHGRERLQLFEAGGFDPDTDWFESPGFQERQHEREEQMREEAEAARRAAMGLKAVEEGITPPGVDNGGRPTTAPSPEARDEWEQYVEDFIRRYRLDPGQQNSAHKFLHTLQEMRDRYLRKRLPEIRKLEAKLRAAQTDDQRAQVEAEYRRINEPLERYFQRLKDKLEKLPTRKQRAAAAERAQANKRKQMKLATGNKAAEPSSVDQKVSGSE